MIKGDRTDRWVHCDQCPRAVAYPFARGDSAIRRSARQEGWTTARGRDLCRACTAASNAAVSAS